MTRNNVVSVATGRPYRVADVGGQTPRELADFTGAVAVGLNFDGERVEISGEGEAAAATVRFHQKDPDHAGRDVRIWTITGSADGSFAAASESAY